MPKLTDTQLVILSAAAQRQDGTVLPLPKSLKTKGDAATKTLEGLREKGLLYEKPAARNAAAWREGEDGRHHRSDRRNTRMAAPYGPGGPHPAASTGLQDRAGSERQGQPLSYRRRSQGGLIV